ncbi:related to TRZ1 - tRNase Z, involved in RNA processing [Moesziomyces antarcticus]|uniref:ribonuclease Z n=1 Tax=Pseudozyma antarctica TaxID=84753 RepID=A0A5C3FT10_PSEA2|nr:related to TRZ1 - tRNase Z, involved in RNA processing [Moesziomyces antarcticus]
MLVDLRVLHVPSSDTNVVPPVVLQLGADRYLFNAGEGTSRSSTQRKANLSRVSNIFVSRVGWETIGGLPGVLMSMADGQRTSEALHGPQGLRYALATMRSYAKRDIMKLNIHEVDATTPSEGTHSHPTFSPIFSDDNLAIYAVPLQPTTAQQRPAKKPKLASGHFSAQASPATLQKLEQLWRRPDFYPSQLQPEEAHAWIQLVSDSIFNDSLLRKRQQQQESGSRVVSSIQDVEMDDATSQLPATTTSSNPSRTSSTWRPPLSPAFVMRPLPKPHADSRNLSQDRLDPAEGGQAPVLAYICQAHEQRGKFDPVKATQLGVPPGPSFAALTRGEDVSLKRPTSWPTMSADDRQKWMQHQRAASRNAASKGKPKPAKSNVKPNNKDTQEPTPAAWNDLEDVLVRSTDVMGASRAGAVVFHIYLPSAAYIGDLLSNDVATAFAPYTAEANRDAAQEQSHTPHAIVHAIPLDVLYDTRYQSWMQSFGPDCNHIIANADVCANKLMFPSSATIPLRLSKLDDVMFKVPQYQLTPRHPLADLSATLNLKLVAAEADQIIQLHPRGEPRIYASGAPDFDFQLDSQEAEKFAAFQVEAVEEDDKQLQQLAKAKAKNAANAKPKPQSNSDNAATNDDGAARSVRLREARKVAWQEYLDIVKNIKAANQYGSIKEPATAPEQDVLVTTLGTGSAAPSKYRNVISTLIQTPSSGTILLDAGESTYGLLRRKFGCRRDGTAAQSGSLKDQDVDDILRDLRILFISHIHADHHIGLIRLLLERRKLQPAADKPLYLVATAFVHSYLEEYEQIERLGLDEDVIFVLNHHLDYKTGVDPSPSAAADAATTAVNGHGRDARGRREHVAHVEGIKELTGLSHVHTARVDHRGSHCYGLVVRHATEGWSVTYSGDTRPAPELIAAGRDCTLLIHEATLEDSELEMAIGKGHSTFGEAIRVGHEMGAAKILLTHFSQRYPKMARSSLFAMSDSAQGKRVPIALAFDMVTYPLSQFERIQSYTPAMEALFAADTEAEAEEETPEANDADGDKGKANGKANGSSSAKGVAVAASVGVAAATTDESSDAKTETKDGQASQQAMQGRDEPSAGEAYVRKGLKPTEWRYLGLCISAARVSEGSLATVLPTLVVELVQQAQTGAMGVTGGAYNVDVLSTHPSPSDEGAAWHALLRVDARHAHDLATSLTLLTAPAINDVRLKLRVVGPTTTIQTTNSLLN